MSSETKRYIFVRIALVSGIGCIAWLLLVKPAFFSVTALRETANGHQELINEFSMNVGSIHSDESVQIENQLEELLHALPTAKGHGDPGTMLHGFITESANQFGVSIASIESFNAIELKQKIKGSGASIKGTTHSARIEFEGDYSSCISFLDEIMDAEFPVKISSFKFNPTGHESIRAIAELQTVVITEIPSEDSVGGDL